MSITQIIQSFKITHFLLVGHSLMTSLKVTEAVHVFYKYFACIQVLILITMPGHVNYFES